MTDDDAVAELVRRTTKRSGVPERVADPTALASIGHVVNSARRRPRPATPRR